MLEDHLANAERQGLWRYLHLENFTHHSTDGPLNPFARVYSPSDVVRDFPLFELASWSQRYRHAPTLPVRRMRALERLAGWHLWVRRQARA